MISEEEFLARARKLVEFARRLKAQKDGGILSSEEYSSKRKQLESELSKLKKTNAVLIEWNVCEIEAGLERLKSQAERGSIGRHEYDMLHRDLSQRKKDIESDKDLIELSASDEYLAFLNGLFEAKKYEGYDKPRIDPNKIFKGKPKKIGDPFPAWAANSYFALLLGGLIIGLVFHSFPLFLFIDAVFTAAVIIATLLAHFSTKVMEVDKASMNRAFSCVMLNMILVPVILFLILLVFSLSIYTVTSAGNRSLKPEFSLSQGIQLYPINAIVQAILAFGISVFCVVRTYETDNVKGTAVAILSYAIGALIWLGAYPSIVPPLLAMARGS